MFLFNALGQLLIIGMLVLITIKLFFGDTK